MIIKIKNLIAFQIYYLLIYNAFVSILGMPDIIKYVLDLNLVLILLLSISRIPTFFKNRSYNRLFIYIIFYMALTVMIALAKSVPPGQILWAVRNNFFYLFFFMICIDVLHKEDCGRIMQNIVKLQIFNVLCAVYEFFIMGERNDFLGGMFGTHQGCNVLLHIYMLVISVYVIVRYLQKLEKPLTLLLVVVSNVAIAAASELKVFFIELALIFVAAVMINNKKSIKNIYILFFAAIGIVIGFNLLSTVNSESVAFFTDFDQFLYYNTRSEYAEGVRINRFTAIQQINDMFFHNDTVLKITGYGFGACESSETFAWCNSSFADKYGAMQYRNLSTSMIYLETGFLGLIMFAAIFISIIFMANKFKKEYESKEFTVQFGQIFALIVLLNCAYNAGIRIEIAYLTFFALSLIFVTKKDYDAQRFKALSGSFTEHIAKSKYIKKA